MCLINVEDFIPADHPIRVVKRLLDEVLEGMSGHFDEICATENRPSVPPETLLKGKVLQVLYTIRSDRYLEARLQTDLLFRWFVDLPLDKPLLALPATAEISSGCSGMRSPTFSFRRW